MNYNVDTGALESAISLPVCQRTVNCDVSEDVAIPEGLPDVRRVIALRENILSPAKFVGARAVDFSGSVDYTLIYVGADGRLYSAPFSADYSFSLPIENAERVELNEGVCLLCSMSGENSSVRISTPRRLQLRAGIRASVLCFATAFLSEELRGLEDASSLERLQLDGECAKTFCESSEAVTLGDEYLLAEGSRIIYYDAAVTVSDTHIDGEVIRASGEVSVRLVIENGERIEKVIRKLPFEAETDLEELELSEEAVFCRAFGTVNELDVSVEEGRAIIEVGLVIEVCVAQNKNIAYTKDVFSTKQKSVCEHKTSLLPRLILNKNASLSQSEKIPLEEITLPEGCEIVDAFGSSSCEEATLENGRYILRGKTKYKLICRKDGEYSSADAELPFKYEAESGSEEVSSLCVRVSAVGVRARAEADGVFLESELLLSASLYCEEELCALSCASFGEEYSDEKNQFVVCFSSSSESLFDIAKRYHAPCESIGASEGEERFVIIER